MDVTAHLEGSGGRKFDDDILARRLFIGIEIHRIRLHIDLVDELILIADRKGVAAVERDVTGMKGAALLDHGMRGIGGKRHAGCSGEDSDELRGANRGWRKLSHSAKVGESG